MYMYLLFLTVIYTKKINLYTVFANAQRTKEAINMHNSSELVRIFPELKLKLVYSETMYEIALKAGYLNCSKHHPLRLISGTDIYAFFYN